MPKELIKEDDENTTTASEADEITIVEEPLDADDSAPATQTRANDDDDDDEDERRIRAEDPDEDLSPEQLKNRERRRLDRQRKKEHLKREKLELDFLRKRNDDLERRLTAQEQRSQQVDLNSYDAQIAKAAQEVEMAERVIAKAVEAGNGEDVTQAMRYRDQALQRQQALQIGKAQTAQVRPAAPGVDQAVVHYAQEFISQNPWYDPQGRDEDSAIVMAIDQSLTKEGLDARSPQYWETLRERAARRLPERFNVERKTADTERKPRGGPAVGSGREHAPATTRREVYISPERKQALIDAGVWDDPVLRIKYVKRYAEYDRQNRA